MKNREEVRGWEVWLSWLLILCPAFVFYAILWVQAVNLPIADDYHAVLDFTNRWASSHGFAARLLHLVTFQHNEYRLIFESAVFAAQYSMLGHTEFYSLIALGNAFVLGIFFVLLQMYRTPGESYSTRLLWLLPVSLLLFQLQYATTLDWAMGVLQNMPVIFFSLGAILLLSRPSRRRLAGACVAMVLAIASSGNGFMVAPVGVLLLAQQRRWREMPVWIMAAGVMTAVYFHHYNFHSFQSLPKDSPVQSLPHFNPGYGLSFLGSSVARYQSYVPSLVLGIVLCGIFLLAARQRYYFRNPCVFYSILFIVFTAVGVSGLRSELGILQSLASRYRIYSNLLLILTYMLLSETYLPEVRSKWVQHCCLVGAILACAGFCAASDLAGYRYLGGRRRVVVHDMAVWQNPGLAASERNAVSETDPAVKRQMEAGFYRPDAAVLAESIRLGVYRPPPALLH